jgi:hypothetical protein
MSKSERMALKLILSLFPGVVALLLAGAGCAPTALVNVWRDPSIARPQLNNLLVISLRKDATRRRMWEDAFAEELSRSGAAATQSYRLYPKSAPDTTQISAALVARGFNGVLTIAPLPSATEQLYVPGYWVSNPGYWFGPHWNRYYRWWWHYQQPQVETYTLTRNEVDVYMTHEGGETMVWSGTNDQTDPATMEEVRASVAKQVVARLAKQGVIAGKE